MALQLHTVVVHVCIHSTLSFAQQEVVNEGMNSTVDACVKHLASSSLFLSVGRLRLHAILAAERG